MIFRLFVARVCLFVTFSFFVGGAYAKQIDGFNLIAIEKPRVLRKANNYLGEDPQLYLVQSLIKPVEVITCMQKFSKMMHV